MNIFTSLMYVSQGELFLKCSVCLYWDYLKGMEQIEEFKALREASQRYLRINSVKLLVDGVIGILSRSGRIEGTSTCTGSGTSYRCSYQISYSRYVLQSR
jgi:hypothetical protein